MCLDILEKSLSFVSEVCLNQCVMRYCVYMSFTIV